MFFANQYIIPDKMNITKQIKKETRRENMKNNFVMPNNEEDMGGFVIGEIVIPLFDSKYRDKPLGERWREHRNKKGWFDPRMW